MKAEKLIEPALDWTGGTWGERVDAAASYLFLHGFITASTRASVTRKLEKEYRAALAEGRIAPRDGASA